jgi:2-keto-3-deoxy-L-rhamnonate aldolase RhmA
MRAIEKFRQDLQAGRVCLGAAVTFADPLVSEALADAVDFLWLDLEHSPMSPEALNGHLMAARAKNVVALVRVRGFDTPFIKAALDGGADGIVVPQIRTVDEVRQVVADCRYPPVGRRGCGPRVPSNYGRDWSKEFVEQANKTIFVSVQIETAEAMEAIDEIVGVPGLDSLVIGPMDLSGALGVFGEVEHPWVVAAMERIIAKARGAGLAVGAGMGADVEFACTLASRGVQWMHVGVDFQYLTNSVDQLTLSIRERLGSAESE